MCYTYLSPMETPDITIENIFSPPSISSTVSTPSHHVEGKGTVKPVAVPTILLDETPTEPVDEELTRAVTTQLEIKYWLDGKYPSQEELQRRFTCTAGELKSIGKKVNAALKKRDLPTYTFQYEAEKVAAERFPDLDPLFVVAVSLICDTLDKRSRAAKLKAVGLSTKGFANLLEEPAHKEYYALRVQKAFGNTHEAAKLSLVRNVEAGDLQSIKFFYEITGAHDPNREIQVNMNKIIMLFMEVLIRHVAPATVEAISREFDVQLLQLNPGA